jgi:hypothetical protein
MFSSAGQELSTDWTGIVIDDQKTIHWCFNWVRLRIVRDLGAHRQLLRLSKL